MGYIYFDEKREKKRKLIDQEYEFVRNNLCSTYWIAEEVTTDEKRKKIM
jgi:hypothetical protein